MRTWVGLDGGGALLPRVQVGATAPLTNDTRLNVFYCHLSCFFIFFFLSVGATSLVKLLHLF